MFADFILCSGDDQLMGMTSGDDRLVLWGLSAARRVARRPRSLGAEGYPICSELWPADIGYDETVTRLDNRFEPDQPAIYSPEQLNRRNQHVGENW